MKHKLIQLISVGLALIFGCGILAAENISVNPNSITTVYDYSQFAKQGSAYFTEDKVNNKKVYYYTNMQVSGYWGTTSADNATPAFITEKINYVTAGNVTMSHDLQSRTWQMYDATGKLTDAFTVAPDATDDLASVKQYVGNANSASIYRAEINYASDGSYTVSWKGTFADDDGDAIKNPDGSLKVGTVRVESYRADRVIKEATTFDKDGTVSGKTEYVYNEDGKGKILTQVNGYTKDKKTGEMTWTSRTFLDPDGKTRLAESRKVGTNDWYQSAEYNYDGEKLTWVKYYDPKDGGGTKLIGTQYFDEHGRASVFKDTQGRVVTQNFYNDTAATQEMSINGYKVQVVAGGILKSVSTAYYADNNSKWKKETTTLYMNGNASTPLVSATTFDNGEAYAAQLAKEYAQRLIEQGLQVWTAYGDPKVEGVVTIDDNGNIALNITSADQMQNILSGLADAIKGNEEWAAKGLAGLTKYLTDNGLIAKGTTLSINANGTITAGDKTITMSGMDFKIGDTIISAKAVGGWGDSLINGLRLRTIQSTLSTRWIASGGTITNGNAGGTGSLKVNIAAINLKTLEEKSYGSTNNTGHATQVNWGDVKDDALMQKIVSSIGGKASLTWDYWSMDASGNVWAFVHSNNASN